MEQTETFDDIIVGAGSSGCVIANRLSGDPKRRVLLLEAGGGDRHPFVTMPKGTAVLLARGQKVWQYPVTQPRIAGVEPDEVWMRGKLLGGGGGINGMIYSRGHWRDYDDWEQRGGPGWGWADMVKAYLAIEDHELGANEYRGAGGPLRVSAGSFRYPLAEAMIEAGTQLGMPRRDDLNHPDLEGIGYYAHTIRRGRRESAATAFLEPVRKRANLVVRTGVDVERVVFEGKRAVGVSCLVDGKSTVIRARGEVILSAGSVMSPVLLERSGVGDGERLQRLGIAVVHHSPLVGERMRDHLTFSMGHRLIGAKGINHRYRSIGRVPDVLRYVLSHKGPMATGPYEVGAFTRSSAEQDRPDLQLYFSPYTKVSGKFTTEREPGFTVSSHIVQTASLGSVHITSPGQNSKLEIAPNYLQEDIDRQRAVAMVRLIRSIVRQPAFAKYTGDELAPWKGADSDDAALEVARRKLTGGTHAVGSCAMGRDESAVLDHHLRVRGVEGLRVIDCASMPGLPSGNTSGPAMALAWRAAELIEDERRA